MPARVSHNQCHAAGRHPPIEVSPSGAVEREGEGEPGGGPDGLRTPEVDRSVEGNHAFGAERGGGAHERSRIPRIPYPVEYQDATPAAHRAVGRRPPGIRLASNREDPLRVRCPGECGQPTPWDFGPRAPDAPSRKEGLESRREGSPGLAHGKHNAGPVPDCGLDRAWAFEHDHALAHPAPAGPDPPQEALIGAPQHCTRCTEAGPRRRFPLAASTATAAGARPFPNHRLRRRLMTENPRPVALTIAGSDSGGGAGIQADIKTFHALGVFGTSAVTAITAQNTLGVSGVHPVPLGMVRAQIEAVVSDLRPDCVKSGMLATRGLVETVADALGSAGLRPYVLDPVMVATSGDRLLERAAVNSVTARLIPLASLVTPNLEEARILTGLPVEDDEGMGSAARRLVEMGADAALVKGGHGTGAEVVDLLFDGRREHIWRRSRIETRSTHGTGCTLSAACAAGLARGSDLANAVDDALRFVERAIRSAPGLGGGHGPLSHFAEEPG